MTGRISRVVDAHVFEIASDAGAARGEPVLIVRLDRGRPVGLGEQVEVSGAVRSFRRKLLEAEFGLRFDGPVDEFEGHSCMVARDMESPSGANEMPQNDR